MARNTAYVSPLDWKPGGRTSPLTVHFEGARLGGLQAGDRGNELVNERLRIVHDGQQRDQQVG